MTALWENLKKGFQTVTDKTEEMTRIGRLKLAIIAVKRDIEKGFIELGGRVYHIQNTKSKIDISQDDQIKAVSAKIKEYEKKLKKLNKDLQQIQMEDSKDINQKGGP
jgi:hypothetical protein